MYRFEFRLFIVSTALMAVLGSCTEQVQPEFADKSEAKIFTATIEQGVTKTLINESLAVEWEPNDRINVNGSVYSAAPGVPATTADFSCVDGDEPQPPYKAFYPSSMVNEDSTYTLPSTQKYVAGRFRCPMYAESDTERLTFANICGVLCLSLTGTDAVSGIQLTTVGEPVCGNFEMTDDSTLCMKEDKKSVYLECGEEGVQLDADKPAKFYFFLPPQTYAPGMEVTIIGPDGRRMKMTTGQEVSVERNTIYVFNQDVVLKYNPGQNLLFGKGEKKWSWANDGIEFWGNAGNSGDGALFTGDVVDGKWWGVIDAAELEGQKAHAGGAVTGAESNDAYMIFSDDGTITAHRADDSLLYSSTYEVRNWDPTRASSNNWEIGKLVTAEPAVLFPFSINEGGKTVTEFDIMYLDANNMTLVYTKGNGAGSWAEITYWRFKPKN